MKFNFNMTCKGLPNATVACEFECTNDELVTLISDPVYQELGRKLISEVSFAPKAQPKAEAKAEELLDRVNGLVSSIKKEREMNEKLRQTEREIVSVLNQQITKLAERNSKF